jgi:hypothetical protein
MFGGFDHLSNAAEAKSRKKREQKQQAQSAADDDGNETGENQDAHSVQESRIKKLASLRLAEAAKIAAEMEVENFEASQLIVPDIPPDLIQDTLAQLIAGHDSKEGRKENPISVEDYMAFFKVAHKKLRSPEARAVLRHLSMTEDSISVISQALINMQRSCFSDCDINGIQTGYIVFDILLTHLFSP